MISTILHICISNKLFGQLPEIIPANLIFWGTFNWTFSCIQVWLDQNYQPIEVGDGMNLTLDKMTYSVVQREREYPMKFDIQLSQFNSIEQKWNMSQVINFYPLLKPLVKTWVANIEKKLLDSTEKFATDYFETSSKREIQKTAEDVVDLICYKINNNIR